MLLNAHNVGLKVTVRPLRSVTVEERGTNATGWTLGGHSRRDGERRMQRLFAHADERALKL
jgi:hypothetical protein